MKLLIENQSGIGIPRKYLSSFVEKARRALVTRKVLKAADRRELLVICVNSAAIRKLNKQYRKKDYATDVLSFNLGDPESFGELVISPEVVRRQAKEHGLTYRQEFSYMVLHGWLHLLGYDHEKSKRAEKAMFELQDAIFETLCR